MKARPWRQRMLARNRKLRRALRVLAKKAWSGVDRNYAVKALKLAPLLFLLAGCTTTYRVHQMDAAEQRIRDAIIQSRTWDVDIKSVGKSLVTDFGRHTAWKATVNIWTELTGGAPLYHASDPAWLINRGHQTECAAWLVKYKSYWLDL